MMQNNKSFVRRQGRLTTGQKKALTTLTDVYVLPNDSGFLNFPSIFQRVAPVIVEIGFGMGDSLLMMAQQHPDVDFIGVEVYRPGIGALISKLHSAQVSNVRILEGDAAVLIPQRITEHSLAGIHIFFPDPWPKKRHHKRRLVQAPLIAMLQTRLQARGHIHLATDWANYAEQMQMVLSQAPDLVAAPPGTGMRVATKYEKRGERLGHKIYDFVFVTPHPP
ncbi:MAG: tRNA (guanosine(46)-N7)-methyltransferase TrmB [Gammaproteobacteria bacterium]